MDKSKLFNGYVVMPGCKIHDLLEANDQAKAKRLSDYCRKAEAVYYEYKAICKLRSEFKDVL